MLLFLTIKQVGASANPCISTLRDRKGLVEKVKNSLSMKGLVVLAALLISAFAVVGCGGSDKQENSDQNAAKKLVEIVTNRGKIVFELYPDKAPKTVDNFIKLANSGFYDGIKWHRVDPGFVIQGGDPLSKDNDPRNDGTGGPGYTIEAEFNDMKHITGTVAMARKQDVDSAGSQFYICLAPAPHLDGKYTIFGKVVEGMDVVNSIRVGDVMEKVTVVTK
jgi:cyclophilin family peptidyl-prolyl cis-trans isomerase